RAPATPPATPRQEHASSRTANPPASLLLSFPVPVPDHALTDPQIAGPLGSLALSQVKPGSSSLALRALKWHEGLTRLGVVLPFSLVHDVGLIFAAPREQYELGPALPAQALVARM